MRQPSLCQPPCPPTRLKFQVADTASDPWAKRRSVMLTGVLRTCIGIPSEGNHAAFTRVLKHREGVNEELASPSFAMMTGVATLRLFPPSAS